MKMDTFYKNLFQNCSVQKKIKISNINPYDNPNDFSKDIYLVVLKDFNKKYVIIEAFNNIYTLDPYRETLNCDMVCMLRFSNLWVIRYYNKEINLEDESAYSDKQNYIKVDAPDAHIMRILNEQNDKEITMYNDDFIERLINSEIIFECNETVNLAFRIKLNVTDLILNDDFDPKKGDNNCAYIHSNCLHFHYLCPMFDSIKSKQREQLHQPHQPSYLPRLVKQNEQIEQIKNLQNSSVPFEEHQLILNELSSLKSENEKLKKHNSCFKIMYSNSVI